MRLTAKAATREEARALIEPEEAELRAILGDLVFGVDDETMESRGARPAARARLDARRRGVGDRWAHRRAHRERPGRERRSQGSIVAYATDVKRSVLGVTAEHVVSEEAAEQMADGARRVLGADVGHRASPASPARTSRTASPSGTVCFGIAVGDAPVEAVSTRLPGDRERIRQFSTISLLNLLRQRLDVSIWPWSRRSVARLRRDRAARRRARRGRGGARRCRATRRGPADGTLEAPPHRPVPRQRGAVRSRRGAAPGPRPPRRAGAAGPRGRVLPAVPGRRPLGRRRAGRRRPRHAQRVGRGRVQPAPAGRRAVAALPPSPHGGPVPRAGRSPPVRRALGKRRVGPAWDVDEVVLVQSHLGHGPAVYEEQARIPLAR